MITRVNFAGIVWRKTYRPQNSTLVFQEFVGSRAFSDDEEYDFTPCSVFEKIFDEKLIDTIVFQTNLYAIQKNGDRFVPTTADELKVFLGINLLMGLKKLPSYRDYWSSIPELRDPYISSLMSVNRFGWLLTHLHLANNDEMPQRNDPSFDKLFKLRPYLEHLSTKFAELYSPEEIQSIDESMIRYKGRSSLKQYMPKKPIKRGYKVWVRADRHGYVSQFQIYTGKSGNTSEKNLGSRVVLDLCESLFHKGYTVCLDNFFTSPSLMVKLLLKGVKAFGTTKRDRKYFFRDFSADKELKTGNYEWRATITGIAAMKWKDKKGVHFLSNFHNPLETTIVNRRQKDGSIKEIPCPVLVKNYCKWMGFVDKADMLKSIYEIDRKSKKWWHRIFFHFLDVSLVNAYILFSLDNDENVKRLSLKEFRLHVALGLTNYLKQTTRGKKKRTNKTSTFKPIVTPERRFSIQPHMPIIGGSRRCALCSTKAEPHRSIWKCEICDVGLCIQAEKNCFREFHQK